MLLTSLLIFADMNIVIIVIVAAVLLDVVVVAIVIARVIAVILLSRSKCVLKDSIVSLTMILISHRHLTLTLNSAEHFEMIHSELSNTKL